MVNNIFWSNNQVISDESIERIEKIIGLKFPGMYRDIIKKHDGATCYINDEYGNGSQGVVIIIGYKERKETISLLDVGRSSATGESFFEVIYETYKECLPNYNFMVPFATTAGGDLYVFDYRENEKNPKVLFLDHERSISLDDLDEDELEEKPLEEWQEETLYFVANSFKELLEKIY